MAVVKNRSTPEAQPPQEKVQQTVQPARGRDENTVSVPLTLETSTLATADKSVEYSADERDEKWVEAIQGAIGQMGRTGDRQYFDFCMCLIWQQAEEDGLLKPDPKHKRWLDELRPIIAKKKHLLCTAEKEIADLKEQLRAGAPAAGAQEAAWEPIEFQAIQDALLFTEYHSGGLVSDAHIRVKKKVKHALAGTQGATEKGSE